MAIRASELLQILFERIASSHPAPAVFARDETDDWPTSAISTLEKAGMLQRTSRANVIVCPECEWQCHKTVVVRTTADQRSARAFIMCDEAPGLGRVPVELSDLDRHATGLRQISEFVAQALGLGNPQPSATGSSYLLGRIRGRQGERSVRVSLETGLLEIIVGTQEERLCQVIRWSGDALVIDAELVRRLANRKERPRSSTSTYQPDRSRQRKGARETSIRDRKIVEEALRLRREPSANWTNISGFIATTTLGEGLSASRVRKIIYEQRSARKNSRAKRTARKPLSGR